MLNGPRHVLMTTDAVGGVWVYATTLAQRYADEGMQVTLVTLGPPPEGAKCDVARALAARSDIELIVTDLPLEWLDPEGHGVPRARTELLRLAERVQPALVHLNGYREATIDWPCPAIVVAHSCVLSWWQATHGDRLVDPRWDSYAENVAAGLNAADAWVAPSQAFRDVIEALYRPATRGRVIHNGNDDPTLGDVDKQSVILASGRVWDEGKNLQTLARAGAGLPWSVHIAGPGCDDAREEWPDNVRCFGEISYAELQHCMRCAGIYAAPARYEPFGLGILEAASAGCALILGDIASLRELWDGAALFVPANDLKALHAALAAVCSHEGLRRTLQRDAAARARRYSIGRTVRGYWDLYQEVLTPARDRAGCASDRLEAGT